MALIKIMLRCFWPICGEKLKKTMYIHIGMHRSGTVFLEKKVFKTLKDINYIDVREEYPDFYKHFVALSDSMIKDSDPEFKALKDFLKEKAKKEKNLISYEGFSGVNYRSLRNKKFQTFKDSIYQIFNDLKKLTENFDLKIILVLREQTSFITSLYKRYIGRGGYEDIYKFIENEIDLPNHDYYAYARELEKFFGAGNIYMLLYENFPPYDTTGIKANTIRALLDFVGEKEMPELEKAVNPESKISKLKNRVVNKGYEDLQIRASRIINPWFRSGFNPNGIFPVLPILTPNGMRFKFIPELILKNRLFEAISSKYEMPKGLQRKIKKYYLASNKKLNQKYGLNLPDAYLKIG